MKIRTTFKCLPQACSELNSFAFIRGSDLAASDTDALQISEDS